MRFPSQTASIALPQGQSATGMFVTAAIDMNSTVSETNESNNVIVFGLVP